MQAADDPGPEDLNHQLVVAAKDGDDARVAALIDRGANCDATHDLGDPDGTECSAVLWAAREGHLKHLPSAQIKRSGFARRCRRRRHPFYGR